MAKKATKRKPKTRGRNKEDMERFYRLQDQRRATREQRELNRQTRQFRRHVKDNFVELRGLWTDLQAHFGETVQASDERT